MRDKPCHPERSEGPHKRSRGVACEVLRSAQNDNPIDEMAYSLVHRVRRQRWLVRARSTPVAFALRQRLHDEWHGLLLPAFEKVFDQECGGEEVIHIASLNLHLHLGSEKEVSRLPELIEQKLVEQLREIVLARSHLSGKRVACKRSTRRQDRLENLLHYLRTGSGTWEAAGNDSLRLANELKETCREQWPEVQHFLRTAQLSAACCFRLFQLISPVEARQAARALLEDISIPQKAPLLEALLLLLESGAKHFGRYVQLQLAAALFLSLAKARHESGVASDFVRALRRVMPPESKALDKFISSLPLAVAALFPELKARAKETDLVAGIAKPLFPPAVPALSQEASRPAGALPSTHAAPPLPHPSMPRLDPWAGRNSAVDSIFGADQAAVEPDLETENAKELFPGSITASPEKQPEAEAEFPLVVTHAGLILLHPFLPRFFESTGVKEETKVTLSPFVLARAAALLHFLATGEDGVFEYDIAFIKVLLGVDPETSLCVSEGLLASTDKVEAERLLGAAITHWAALKNTSIAGFRRSFLQRPALLREEDDGWRLQVERQSFDMLLEHLPWSISVIKLPWMQQPLYTEW